MNICDTRHDEICFLGPDCPLCEVRDQLEGEIVTLKEEVHDLKYRDKHLEQA